MDRVPIRRVTARAYEIPTDGPEADGTLAWDRTTLIVATIEAGGEIGLGYTYADASLVPLIERKLAPEIAERCALDIAGAGLALWRSVRNLGRPGLAAAAISAIDTALWDAKSKILGVSLAALLGRVRDHVPIYGSGGFTSYSDERLTEQLAGWVERDGCRWVKMKIGSEPGRDPERIAAARSAIGDHGLFIDANGAFTPSRALALAEQIADLHVSWFEEPVTSDDLEGLTRIRAHAPPGMEIAAGEYCYVPEDFGRLLAAPSIDVLQADATRCGGISGFLGAAACSAARQLDMSAHCAPALHCHVGCAVPRLRHIEWFHDHVRIEQMLFDGAPVARNGAIAPDLARPGLGLELKVRDAERFRIG